MELVTNAFEWTRPFSLWWLLVPVGIAIVCFILGNLLDSDGTVGAGFVFLLGGPCFLGLVSGATGTTYNADVLRSDLSEQFRIEEVVKDGEWYTGKGPDGEFIKFALVKKDNSENTYGVLMEK